jgi:hypothetical protein
MSRYTCTVGPTNRNLAFPGVGTLIPNRLTDTLLCCANSRRDLLVERMATQDRWH